MNNHILEKNNYKKLDIYISPNSNIREGALDVLQQIGIKWKRNDIKFKDFTDGCTNRLVGCYVEDQPWDMVLVRVYGEGTDLFIDREQEIRNIQLMYEAQLGCPIYCSFLNGICYGFAPGHTLDKDSVRDPKIASKVARQMARMHQVHYDADTPKRPALFDVMRKFHSLAPAKDSFRDKTSRQRFLEQVRSREQLMEEINFLEQELSALNSPVVFCHNDLLLKNIIYNPKLDKVTFVDFEYADYNFEAFDIGNHFCEFAGLYPEYSSSNLQISPFAHKPLAVKMGGMDVYDPSLYPSEEFQRSWLTWYLESRDIQDGLTLDQLLEQVNKFALASHFMWGLWSLVQSVNSSLHFDYLGYGISRFDEYFSSKERTFNS